MPQFRKRPVVIEANQWGVHDDLEKGILGNDSMAIWLDKAYGGIVEAEKLLGASEYVLRVQTLEGPLNARVGDWIIKGVKGEFYPCRPDIFAATYEIVEPDKPLPADYWETAE